MPLLRGGNGIGMFLWSEEKSGQLGDMFGILGGNCAISDTGKIIVAKCKPYMLMLLLM